MSKTSTQLVRVSCTSEGSGVIQKAMIKVINVISQAMGQKIEAITSDEPHNGQVVIHLIYIPSSNLKNEIHKALVILGEQYATNPKTIPLFATDGTTKWESVGIDSGSEFVWNVYNNPADLVTRLSQLLTLYPDGVSPALASDFLSGFYRRELGLNHDLHGVGDAQSVFIALRQWLSQKDCNKDCPPGVSEKLEGKSKTPLDWIIDFTKPPYNRPFLAGCKPLHDNAQSLLEAVKSIKPGTETDDNFSKATHALSTLQSHLPRWYGHGLTNFFAVKPCVLVVDDEGTKMQERLEGIPLGIATNPTQKLATQKLKDVISFESAFTDADQKHFRAKLIKFLHRESATLALRHYDAVLLDLSFSNTGSDALDPLGWSLLPILRQFLPDIPIIIHSSYGNASQIRRAYENEASWFLNKDESFKLPVRLRDLLFQTSWKREWDSRCNEIDFDLPPTSASKETWDCIRNRYLWYKVLEKFPGSNIRIRTLGGGISDAVTVKAWKEIGGSFNLLPPMVIKIEDHFPMSMEYERYRRFIGPYLSNRAGRVDRAAIRGGNGKSAIGYTCAGASQGVATVAHPVEITTLQELLVTNLPRHRCTILPARRYETVMHSLLNDILPRIHQIIPDKECAPALSDYPNPVFGEFGNPLNAYLARFPATRAISLTQPLRSLAECSKPGDSDCDGGKLMILEPDIKARTIQALYIPSKPNAFVERIDLIGPLAAFYTESRYLRRYEVLALDKADQATFIDANPALKADSSWGWNRYNLSTEHNERVDWLRHIDSVVSGDEMQSSVTNVLSQATRFLRDNAGAILALTPQGIIHGDLNLGNIMVERALGGEPVPASNDPWLIDFAWSRRDAIVIDYAQLEVDLLLRLGQPHVFQNNGTIGPKLIIDFRNAYLETPWLPPDNVVNDERRMFLWSLMNQVRCAADRAGINAMTFAYARLLALMIVAKIYLKRKNGFSSALSLSWIQHQHSLLAGN